MVSLPTETNPLSQQRAPLTESYWPASQDAELYQTTCGSVLRASAARWPDKVALVDPGEEGRPVRRWTYSALLTEAEKVANLLAAQFPKGTHVAIYAANCPEWVFVQFGVALAGMVLVTVNPACNAAELGYILRQSRSRAVFHQQSWRSADMGALVDQAAAQEQLDIALKVNVDDPAGFPPQDVAPALLPEVVPGDPAMIQYTSGTTGYPKGVLLSHHQIANTSRIMAEVKELDESTINLSVAPLFHTGGCVGGVLGALQIGSTLILLRSFEPEFMLDLIEAEKVTYTFAVPTMLISLLQAQRQRPRDLSSLTMVFSGGATVPVSVVQDTEREFGVRLIIGYGLTESSPAITHTRPGDNTKDISETIGRAIPLVEVKIADPETGAIQPIGVSGELCCRGFNVMMGYYEMPEATAATVDADGWLHSGDLCQMDERGYCRITGRLKDMIIRGGENIYPREIEEALMVHPDVASVAVFGIADEYWGEQVGCAFVPKPGQSPSAAALAEHCGKTMARHKVPKIWFAMADLPLTPSGKIQKFRLGELAAAGDLDYARL
jgi:fatty-acyl-CoA synthase